MFSAGLPARDASRQRPVVASVQLHLSRLPLMLVAMLLVLLASFAWSGVSAAHAHDELVGSEGTVVGSNVELVLSFSGNLRDIGTETFVTDQSGAEVLGVETTVNGRDLVLVMAMPKLDETITVAWRVVSEDHHPIEARSAFAVVQGADGLIVEPRDVAPVVSDQGTADVAQGEEQWLSYLIWSVLGIVAIVAAVGVFISVYRRNNPVASRTNSTADEGVAR